jgi:hypothetical protein
LSFIVRYRYPNLFVEPIFHISSISIEIVDSPREAKAEAEAEAKAKEMMEEYPFSPNENDHIKKEVHIYYYLLISE